MAVSICLCRPVTAGARRLGENGQNEFDEAFEEWQGLALAL